MDAPKLEDFRMTSKLGEGTFSEVMKIKHKTSGKVFAMKRFRKRFQNVEEIQNLREIQALRRLNPHDHVIDLIDVIFDLKSGILGLTFELMECNLYEMISKKSVIMTESKAKTYFYQICKAMEYMHGYLIIFLFININILIKEGNIKLADFGSCRGIHSKHPYTEYIATRWYRAPECLLCDGTYNYKMDIWGAGCVLYEIITKNPLFPGANELDQLHKIHDVLGSPSPSTVKKLQGTRKLGQDYNFPPKQGTGLKSLLQNVSQDCLSITSAMLAYDPDDRISAKEVLRHSFFKSLVADEKSNSKDKLITSKENLETSNNSNSHTEFPKKETKTKNSSLPSLPQISEQASSTNTILKTESVANDTKNSNSQKDEKVSHIPHLPTIETQKNHSQKGVSFVNNEASTSAKHVASSNINSLNTIQIHSSYQVVQKINQSKERPTFEAPPTVSNTSNYHVKNGTTVLAAADIPATIQNKNEKTGDNNPMMSYKNTAKFKRYLDDKKSLDVALARARRAANRQREITDGRVKGRILGNTSIHGQEIKHVVTYSNKQQPLLDVIGNKASLRFNNVKLPKVSVDQQHINDKQKQVKFKSEKRNIDLPFLNK